MTDNKSDSVQGDSLPRRTHPKIKSILSLLFVFFMGVVVGYVGPAVLWVYERW